MNVLRTQTDMHDSLSETCARLEHLMTLEIRPLTGGLPAGIIAPTAALSRSAQSGAPVLKAVQGLTAACQGTSEVIVVTGAGVAPALPSGETDGPLGAVVLARGIAMALGARVTIVSEDSHAPAAKACLAELTQSDGVDLRAVPVGISETDVSALISPATTAIIFVEKDGPNETGSFHGIRGNRRPEGTVSGLHKLADLARERGIFTVGVGDGGNEVGFGKIRSELMQILPRHGRALSSDEGVVTVTETNVLITASVSNWGAYAINAGLAVAMGRPDLLHSADDEIRLIRAAVAAGARDGATSRPDEAVDGISKEGNAAIASLMQDIVRCALAASVEFEI